MRASLLTFIFIPLLALLSSGLINNIQPQVATISQLQVSSTNSEGILRLETVPFADQAMTLLTVDSGRELLIGTQTSRVYTYNDASFTKVLDRSRILGNRTVFGLFEDQQGNIFISIDGDSKIFKSSDRGSTWIQVFADGPLIHFNVGPKPSWSSFGNGTIIVGSWTSNYPYVWRSNDWGETWRLWLNFTAIFPEYAIPVPGSPMYNYLRHIHSLEYLPQQDILFVNTGDGVHAMLKSTDGGATWQMVRAHGYTSRITLSDRILWGTDGWLPMLMYNISSDSFQSALLPTIGQFNTRNVFRSFAYDPENDILYFGADSLTSGWSVYPSLLASVDRGKTWVWLRRLEDTPITGKSAPDLAVFGDYIYLVYDTVLKRFPRLTKAEVSYIGNQDSTSKTIWDKSDLSFSNVVYKNPNITIEKTTLQNLLVNPSFETWATPPPGWTSPYGTWTGTRNYARGQGWHGQNSYNVSLQGYGSTKVSSSSLTLTAGYYYLSAFHKITTAYYNASSYPLASDNLYVIASGGIWYASWYERLLPCIMGDWHFHEVSFYIPSTSTISVTFIAGSSTSGYPVNMTDSWDGFTLYKYDIPGGIVNASYTATQLTTTDGELIVGNQTVAFGVAELPKTVPLNEYIYGYVPLTLVSGNIAKATISGEEVLKISNGIIERKSSDPAYIGKMYDNFTVTKNTENALIISYQYPVNVTSASFTNKQLTYTVNAPALTTSTVRVYVADEGEPALVSITNGTLSWSYDASTKILTLIVSYAGSASIFVDWRILGDVNGDGVVNTLDLIELKEAYGSTLASPNWNPNCDFNRDNIIDARDLELLGKNYGKTTP